MNLEAARSWVRGEWWWRVSRHFTMDNVRMKIAWALPRRIALWAFIRVMAATGDNPDSITYESAYKAWEAGAGR